MAHHNAAKKKIRQTAKRSTRNHYKSATMRSLIKGLRGTTDKKEAEALLTTVVSTIDKVAKSNIIHKNKAANMKSKLTKYVNEL